jgi:hypothetical protein
VSISTPSSDLGLTRAVGPDLYRMYEPGLAVPMRRNEPTSPHIDRMLARDTIACNATVSDPSVRELSRRHCKSQAHRANSWSRDRVDGSAAWLPRFSALVSLTLQRKRDGVIPCSLHVACPNVREGLQADGLLRQLARSSGERLIFFCFLRPAVGHGGAGGTSRGARALLPSP